MKMDYNPAMKIQVTPQNKIEVHSLALVAYCYNLYSIRVKMFR